MPAKSAQATNFTRQLCQFTSEPSMFGVWNAKRVSRVQNTSSCSCHAAKALGSTAAEPLDHTLLLLHESDRGTPRRPTLLKQRTSPANFPSLRQNRRCLVFGMPSGFLVSRIPLAAAAMLQRLWGQLPPNHWITRSCTFTRATEAEDASHVCLGNELHPPTFPVYVRTVDVWCLECQAGFSRPEYHQLQLPCCKGFGVNCRRTTGSHVLAPSREQQRQTMPAKSAQATNFTRQLSQFTSEPSMFGVWNAKRVSRVQNTTSCSCHAAKALGSTAAEPLDHTFLLLQESNRDRRCQPSLLRQRTSPANFPSLRQNRRCLVFGMSSGFLVSRIPLAAAAMLQRFWGQLPPNHQITRSCSFTRATEADDASQVCSSNELHPPTFPVYVRTVDVWCLECQAGFSCPEYHQLQLPCCKGFGVNCRRTTGSHVLAPSREQQRQTMPAKSAQATNFTRQLSQFTSEPSMFGVWNAKRVSRDQNTTSCTCHAAKALGSTAAEPLDHTFLLLHESNRGRRCQPSLLRQRTSPANFPSLRQNRRCLVFGMPSGFLVSRIPLAAAAMLQRLWGQLPPNHWITRSCSFTRATEADDASQVCSGNELHPPTFPVYVRTVDVWCLECQAGFSCPECH